MVEKLLLTINHRRYGIIEIYLPSMLPDSGVESFPELATMFKKPLTNLKTSGRFPDRTTRYRFDLLKTVPDHSTTEIIR